MALAREKGSTLPLGPIDGEHWKQLKAGTWMGTDGTGMDVLIEGVPGT